MRELARKALYGIGVLCGVASFFAINSENEVFPVYLVALGCWLILIAVAWDVRSIMAGGVVAKLG